MLKEKNWKWQQIWRVFILFSPSLQEVSVIPRVMHLWWFQVWNQQYESNSNTHPTGNAFYQGISEHSIFILPCSTVQLFEELKSSLLAHAFQQSHSIFFLFLFFILKCCLKAIPNDWHFFPLILTKMESWIHFQEVLACLHISAHMRCFYNRSVCYPKQDHGGKDTYYQACELIQELIWTKVGQFNNSSSRASDSK